MTYDSARHSSDITSASLVAEAALSRHGDFMEALIAGCAIIAHADGEMASAERRRVLGLVRETAALSVFSREDIVDEVAIHEANYRLDPEVAHLLAVEKLIRVAAQRRLARLVINACREIIPADGIAHPAEYRALGDVKRMLGFDEAPVAFRATDAGSRDISRHA